MASNLASPITLPCGLTLPNRLVKASMGEVMGGTPNGKYIQAYTTWGSGKWGGILTGNADVSTMYRGSTQNLVIPPKIDAAALDSWKQYAHAIQREGTPGIIQLVHPGRQSPAGQGDRSFFSKAIAPSAIPLNFGPGVLNSLVTSLVFGSPREMTVQEIETVIAEFTHAAKLISDAGFKGIEIHAAHGYLLSQFLSPKGNIRTDAYGGSAAKRAKIVIDIIRSIRKEVPSDFCVGVKLNSADVGGVEILEESLEQVALILAEQVDFLEISGGTYENPRMATGDGQREPEKSKRTAEREAFFLDYAKAVRARHPKSVLMVTGGFRSRTGMQAALDTNACDIIGIGRPAAVKPHWPKDVILNESVKDEDAVLDLPIQKPKGLVAKLPIKLIHGSWDTLYYVKHINTLGKGQMPVV
ncbi:FMN binding oxidoreductase [Sporormia fimetaria CBS 119925]|uniref:FMN binding oxidoreductase n=1 Tax=Sporormia fimetaria CBS 119925 TaxID=1340428 RepID=A0A6A6VP34_9PLEO|nr:FMN binding oxidoreductase [Sporormia fimetaria CBS 119925]